MKLGKATISPRVSNIFALWLNDKKQSKFVTQFHSNFCVLRNDKHVNFKHIIEISVLVFSMCVIEVEFPVSSIYC